MKTLLGFFCGSNEGKPDYSFYTSNDGFTVILLRFFDDPNEDKTDDSFDGSNDRFPVGS